MEIKSNAEIDAMNLNELIDYIDEEIDAGRLDYARNKMTIKMESLLQELGLVAIKIGEIFDNDRKSLMHNNENFWKDVDEAWEKMNSERNND